MQGTTELGVSSLETKENGVESDPEFIEHWAAVMRHFNCTKAERNECWKLAKADPENARRSYALMARSAWLRAVEPSSPSKRSDGRR